MQTATDFFKSALFQEVHAGAFYNKASEITHNDESRMLFLEMAQMEDDHARSLIERAKNAPCVLDFDPYQYLTELESNMEATISENEMNVIQNGDLRTVLALAIELENQARDTYEQLALKATSPEVASYCQEMVKIEQKHKNALTNLLLSLDMTPDERPGL
ncbi:MAG: ferritin family protein [Magnetococcus sp. DMHC-6]